MADLASLNDVFAGARPDALVMAALLAIGALVFLVTFIAGASLCVASRAETPVPMGEEGDGDASGKRDGRFRVATAEGRAP